MATKLIGLATILLHVANDDFVFLHKNTSLWFLIFSVIPYKNITLPEANVGRLRCDKITSNSMHFKCAYIYQTVNYYLML